MHRHVGLSAVLMPQHQVGTALSANLKSRFQQLLPNFPRLVRHGRSNLDRGQDQLSGRTRLLLVNFLFFQPKFHQIFRGLERTLLSESMGRQTQAGNMGIKVSGHVLGLRNRFESHCVLHLLNLTPPQPLSSPRPPFQTCEALAKQVCAAISPWRRAERGPTESSEPKFQPNPNPSTSS